MATEDGRKQYQKRDKVKIEDLTHEQLVKLATAQDADLVRLKQYRRNVRSAYSSLQTAYDLVRYALLKANTRFKVLADVSTVEDCVVFDLQNKLDAAKKVISEQRITIERLRGKLRSTANPVSDDAPVTSTETAPGVALRTVENG